MVCRVVNHGGVRAIVCGPRTKAKPCACGSGKPADLLCDGVIEVGTCDLPLCSACTDSPEDGKDFCPDHAPVAKQKGRAAKRGSVPMVDPICVECTAMAEPVDSAVIYPHRPDLHGRVMFLCSCGAYVGAHPGTDVPLGYPAGPETRRLRSQVHKLLDPLWEAKMKRDGLRKGQAREDGYTWLAAQLHLAREDTHVSHFTAAVCRQAIAILEPIHRAAQERAARPPTLI